MDRIRPLGLVLYGFGRVGQAALELALSRPWLEVRGIITRSAAHDGIAANRVTHGAPAELRLSTDARATLAWAQPDVVIMATTSRLVDLLPGLRAVAESGARAVLCSAEELAFVEPDASAAAAELYRLASDSRLAIVATGVNPGFVFDLWPLVVSGLAWDVASLRARRVVDVSVFAPRTRRRLGIGYSAAGFAAGIADGSIAGHLGFAESLHLLADAMGRKLDAVSTTTQPIMAERRCELADGVVEKGTTSGATQHAQGIIGGRPWLSLELVLHVSPASDGLRTIDEIHLEGRSELHVTVDPGCPAIVSTAAQLVNGIPRAMAAEPGVYRPGALPPSSPWLAASPPRFESQALVRAG